tara:strand:- start:498 stop:794 length:297 start_codon:yes stop_codon:yes gene_type:complete
MLISKIKILYIHIMGCQQAISKTLESFANCKEREHFSNNKSPVVDMLIQLISFVIVIVIVSLVGAYLWNNSVTNVFSGAKKAKWMDILGLTILLKLVL